MKRCLILCLCVGLLFCVSSCAVVRDEERLVTAPDQAVVVPSPPEPSVNPPSMASSEGIVVTQSPQDSPQAVAESPQTMSETPLATQETAQASPSIQAGDEKADGEMTSPLQSTSASEAPDQETTPVPEEEILDEELFQGQDVDSSEVTSIESSDGSEGDETIDDTAPVDASETDYIGTPDNAAYTSDGRSVAIVSSILLLMILAALYVQKRRRV